MTDDLMKRSREWLQSCVNAATRSGTPEEADLEAFLLAHIDGEPARIAAAREEQREACALRAGAGDPEDHDHAKAWPCWWCAKANEVREVPLTATPLGDEVRALREVVQGMNEGALVVVSAAEYDELKALRARVAELEERMGVVLHAGPSTALSVSVFGRAKKAEAEREALRARVAELEASKKTLDAVCAVLGREVGNRGDSEGAVDVAERIIRERDEAVAALRALRASYLADGGARDDEGVRLANRALAKYPEGR